MQAESILIKKETEQNFKKQMDMVWLNDFLGKYAQRGGELDPPLSRRFAFGIIPNPDISGLDNSAIKFQYALLLKFEPHYDLQFRYALLSELGLIKGKG
jgi:hypothetical protein